MDIDAFIGLNNEQNDVKCMDNESLSVRLNDAEAAAVIRKVAGCASVAELPLMESGHRDQFVKELKANGLSIRQISRLTGISFALVRRA